ncbi:MAG: UDP-glucose 6-dehydrogenase [Rhodospirillaceae bacterium]|nr:UDP-glucose 6-dehydrogenase [Rhodospirillaceae bacterium]|tara:strand:- start:5629 stop:6990 length:1362 start_codon:yes stop_codon:yes gene_type:complete
MNVTIFGAGYVGLVTGACLAETGHDVLCVDIDRQKIDSLKKGKVPIFEPGLERILKKTSEAGKLSFTVDIEAGVRHGLLLFIAVGTPQDEDGSADLQYVLTVSRSIANHLDDYRLVVNKSTVPVGTADKVQTEIKNILDDRGVEIEFDVASNPEFLKEGAAIEDFIKPDRIIIGSDSSRAFDLLRSLYEPFNRNHEKIITMDARSAELSKYAANSMLATKISFMNELANISDCIGADIEKVRLGIGSDPRIGYSFIYPGCGYGGSCFPKDVRALSHSAKASGYNAQILDAVDQTNNRQKEILFHKIKKYFKNDLQGKVIGVWGLAFKPNTDDMREASSLSLVNALMAAGCQILAYDPVAMNEAKRIFGLRDNIDFLSSSKEATRGADALVIVTEWKEFRSPDFDQLKLDLKNPVIFDGRNIYDPEKIKNMGFKYFAIGRGESISIDYSKSSVI